MEQRVRKFWLRDNNNRPVALVGYTQDEYVVRYSMAILNPKDKFDRRKAHNIVEGRLISKNEKKSISKYSLGVPSFPNIRKGILTEVKETHSIERVRLAADTTLTHFENKKLAESVEAT